MVKVSLVITVKNEENSIEKTLQSIIQQSVLPSELIIVDGGSKDKTPEIIKRYSKKHKWIKLFIIKGATRGEGRDAGVKRAKNNVIAFTDGGCILDKNWIKEITKPFKDKKIDVVVGAYKPYYNNDFEYFEGLIVVPSEERIFGNPSRMSIRSFALRKNVWLENPYPKVEPGDDTLFNIRLIKKGYKFTFAKNAIVYWMMKRNLKSLFNQFYKYGYGDFMSGNLRMMPRNLLFVSCLWFYIVLILVCVLMKYLTLFIVLMLLPLFYLLSRSFIIFLRTKKLKSFFYIPLLELIKRSAYSTGVTTALIIKLIK